MRHLAILSEVLVDSARRAALRVPALLCVPFIAAICCLVAQLGAYATTLISLVMFALQTIGLRIMGGFGFRFTPLSRNILGTVIGVVILSTSQQLLFRVENQTVPLAAVLAIAILIGITNSETLRVGWTDRSSAVEFRTWTLGLASALAIWSQTHFWPLFWAISAALAMFLVHDSRRWKLWIPLTLVSFPLAEFATGKLKSTNWPLFAEEHVFYELLSTSLALRPTSSPLFSATSGITYHWLSYAFAGWVTRAVDAPEFVIAAGFLPIFFAVLAVALLLDHLKSHTLSVVQVALLALCIGTFGSRMGEGNMHGVVLGLAAPSFALAICAVCGLFLTTSQILANCSFQAIFIGGLLAFAALGSYLAIGLIPVGAVIVLLAFGSVQVVDRQVRRQRVIAALVLAGAALASLRIFAGFPNSTDSTTARLAVLPLFGFVEDLTGEVFVLSGFLRTVAKFGYFAGLITPALLLATRPRKPESSGFDHLMRISALLSIVGITVIQDDSYASSRVLVTSLQYFAIPLLVMTVIRQQFSRVDVLKSTILGLVVWLTWLVEDARRAHLGGPENVMFRAAGQAAPALVGIVGFACSLIGWRAFSKWAIKGHRSWRNGASRAWTFATVAVLVFGSLQGVSTSVEAWGMYQPRFEDWGASYSANGETRSAAQFVKTNSDSAALIAVDMADGSLQLQHFSRLAERQILVIGSTLWAQKFYSDSDGPRLLQLQRLLSTPSRDLIEKLEMEGVTHIILRRELSRQRFLTLVGSPDFKNDTWAVYTISGLRG